MEENMILIREINKLRREIKVNSKEYDNLKLIFKTKRSKDLNCKQIKINNILKSGKVDLIKKS